MTHTIIKIIDATVAAARLYAATRRIPELRHIAKELRHEADEFDAQADSLEAAMGERVDA